MKTFLPLLLLALFSQASFAAGRIYLKATYQNSFLKTCRIYAHKAEITTKHEDGSLIREVKETPYSGRTLARLIKRSRKEPLVPTPTICDGGTTKFWGLSRKGNVSLVQNLDCVGGSEIRKGDDSQKLKVIAQRYCGIYLDFYNP